jgi:hypothetical protein
MTKARTNASASPAVGRNMVINGAMNVAQRSASVTGLGGSSAYYTLDRWKLVSLSTAGRLTMSQTADGPNGISANCLKLDCTTADASIAAGEILLLRQGMEGQNVQRIGKGVAGAKQITVSFYVKASAAFTFGVELEDTDNSRQITKLFATTTDWVRHSFVIAADEDDGSSAFADDNAESLRVNFILHAGSNFTSGTLNTASFANATNANRVPGIDSFFSSTDNNFFLTGVQLEVGPVATEFEQEDITTTLVKCQRYYYKLVNGTDGTYVPLGIAYRTTDIQVAERHPIAMRANPSIAVSGNLRAVDGISATVSSGAVIANVSRTSTLAWYTNNNAFSGLTAFRPYLINGESSGNYFEVDAEL